ncbi:MAG: hypothetical protein R3B70_24325 [Polyangiaceae bacterium]
MTAAIFHHEVTESTEVSRQFPSSRARSQTGSLNNKTISQARWTWLSTSRNEMTGTLMWTGWGEYGRIILPPGLQLPFAFPNLDGWASVLGAYMSAMRALSPSHFRASIMSTPTYTLIA